MRVKNLYQRKMILDVSEEIELEDPLKFNWLTFPGLARKDVGDLVSALDMAGELWAHTDDVDFLELDDDSLWYVMQIPGVYASVDLENIKVPFFLFPLRNESFIIHVYTEEDIEILEPHFNDGHFLVSRKGLNVSVLESVPPVLKDLILKYYCGS